MTHTAKIKTRRICAGHYTVTNGQRSVTVTEVYYPNDGIYWIAAPEWTSNTSDPLPTKRDAVASATYWINNPTCDEY